MSDVNIVVISGSVEDAGDIIQAGNSRKRNVKIKSVKEFQGRDGSVKASSNFVDVEIWGETADRSGWIANGAKVLVSGRLSYDSWTTDDGTKKYRTVVRADSIEGIGAQAQSSYNPNPAPSAPYYAPQQQQYGGYQAYQQGYQQVPPQGYANQQAAQYGVYASAPQQPQVPQSPAFNPPPQPAPQPAQSAQTPAVSQQPPAPQNQANGNSDLPF